MNGAVQGVATTTASTPVKKAARVERRAVRPWPMPIQLSPKDQTPENSSAIANSSQASARTNRGDCS